MIAITMLTVKEGRLIKIKVATEYENEVLMHYGKDWHNLYILNSGFGHLIFLSTF